MQPLATPLEKEWLARDAERRIELTTAMLDAFTAVSGDDGPIHVDEGFARGKGFRGRVVHGMLLGALVSQVLGTELPGADGVLQEIRLAFRRPCYVGDVITIRLTVQQFSEAVQTLRLRVTIANQDGAVVADGEVQSGIRTGIE